VLLRPVDAWIGQVGEVAGDRRVLLGHGGPP
jgi:hypothetical protein